MLAHRVPDLQFCDLLQAVVKLALRFSIWLLPCQVCYKGVLNQRDGSRASFLFDCFSKAFSRHSFCAAVKEQVYDASNSVRLYYLCLYYLCTLTHLDYPLLTIIANGCMMHQGDTLHHLLCG